MKYLLIVVVLAGGGFFAWKKLHPAPAPAEVANPDKTPGADVQNRVNNLSGVVADP